MRIQHTNNLNNQLSETKNGKAARNNFEHVLQSHIKNDSAEEFDAPQPRASLNTEQLDYTGRLALSPIKQNNEFNGVKELVRDALSDMDMQIMREIDLLCEDASGENIDIQLLDDFLNVCKEAHGEE